MLVFWTNFPAYEKCKTMFYLYTLPITDLAVLSLDRPLTYAEKVLLALRRRLRPRRAVRPS